MMKRIPKSNRGQTILEYVLLVIVVALPIGAAMKGMLEDKDEKEKNVLYLLVKDSYGEENRLGVIGRPYP